jgi:N-acylneuraminate cytidylyltransferase
MEFSNRHGQVLILSSADLTVSSFAAPIDRALAIENGYIKMRQSANRLVRSQDLPKAYHDAGQFC